MPSPAIENSVQLAQAARRYSELTVKTMCDYEPINTGDLFDLEEKLSAVGANMPRLVLLAKSRTVGGLTDDQLLRIADLL